MEKVTAIGMVGKQIFVEKLDDGTTLFSFTTQVNYEKINPITGEAFKSTNSIQVKTRKKAANAEAFEKKLTQGTGIYVKGFARPVLIMKDDKQYPMMEINNAFCIALGAVNKDCSMITMEAIGYIGNVRINRDGEQDVCNFSLAHNYKQSNNQEYTLWISCSLWRPKDKTKVFDFLERGKLVRIEGSPRVSTYQTGDNQMNINLECVVDALDFLASKQAPSNPLPPETKTKMETEEEDLPF